MTEKLKACKCEVNHKTRTPYYNISNYGYTHCESCQQEVKGAGKHGERKGEMNGKTEKVVVKKDLMLTKHHLFTNNINLQAKQQIAQQQYELQNNYLISTANLADNPAIHSFFTDLLTTYAEKFAGSKSINTSQLPLKFAGFYDEQEAGRNLGTMDRAETILYPASQKVANIY
ncbi:6984_t:CDS:2 [Racocetra persica]|uniref:6984_t:CDS:1 n=1 Tax=Racocetra persica TaxID=160502 RepID=A0ACA9K8X1_9GLOM|nr:6984_t:CDS:2 [Racocetra persica]